MSSSDNKHASLFDCLQKYKLAKNDKKEVTHTRIGDTSSNIYGGKYHVPDEDYPLFMKTYYHEIYEKNIHKKEFLTERQFKDDGPLVIDVDLRHDYDIDERQFTDEHVDDLVDLYLDTLKKIYNMNEDTNFNVFIMKKPTVNRLVEKQCTKDGLHIIICLKVERDIQMFIRDEVIRQIPDVWGDDSLKLINSWTDVFDKGISQGTVNWQLQGSRKPNHERYKVTKILDVRYDVTDKEMIYDEIAVSKYDFKKNFTKLSVRNPNNPSLLIRNSFIPTFDEYKRKNNLSNITKKKTNYEITPTFDVSTLSTIKCKEDLEHIACLFLDSLTPSDYELRESHELVMALPVTYYGNGSYDNWIKVRWCLRNISERLLITWLLFSSQSSVFNYNDIPDLCSEWTNTPNRQKSGGLTKLSLLHWVKTENRSEYDRISASSIDTLVLQALSLGNKSSKGSDSGCSDFDLANVLYTLFKSQFVCVSLKSNDWYYYADHRWRVSEKGMKLRQQISKRFREIFREKSVALTSARIDSNAEDGDIDIDEENNSETERTRLLLSRCHMIIARLGSTSEKEKIMTECRELYYYSDFLNELDTNPYLLCCSNGVFDFKEKVFRAGVPEDYLSQSTNINYIKIEAEHAKIVDEITDFMSKLFPEESLREYMWDHLASCLMGTSTNQTFNMYIGKGSNGKSVLIDLMSKVLGDYKGEVPITLITTKRGQVGAASPELVSLKGKRMAVMQEPDENAQINEGIMKELTSGKDPIKGRGLYQATEVRFLPQFNLVVASNYFLGVRATDNGTWRRIRSVPFKSRFSNAPDPNKEFEFEGDPNIDDKFDEWKEVFLSMLIARACETNGYVKDCEIVLKDSNEYRKSMDIVTAYIEDNIVKDSDKTISKTELNHHYNTWHEQNYGTRSSSPKKLHDAINERFWKCVNAKWKGITFVSYEDETKEDDANTLFDQSNEE